MKEQEFKIWLYKKYQQNTANSRWSNCRTVEYYEGDLDEHFNKDKCKQLIERLSYSVRDERANKPLRHNIPINGNVRNGTATLKQAVKLYMDFRNGVEPNKVSESISPSQLPKQKIKSDWPVWAKTSNDDLFELVKLTARFAKFLHPEVVAAMMENNNKNWSVWRANLKLHNINPDIYLWHRSPCAFPGVRRNSGKWERENFRKQAKENIVFDDALWLDDNDFPKHLWSFIFRGKPFQKNGPKGYALAHLADHQEYKNRLYKDFGVERDEASIPNYGLYTAPTNLVYLPTSMIRPSDFSVVLRRVLIEKAHALYDKYCAILPSKFNIEKEKDSKWHFQNFEWADPVGDPKNIDLFLDFRNRKMVEFFNKNN